jgi:hypothetical protein
MKKTKLIIHKISAFIPFPPSLLKKSIYYFIVINLFLSSCHRALIDPEKKAKITAFFEEFLLEHGGAYTLFGSKPVTVEDLVDCSEEALQKIQQYLNEHPEIETLLVDRKLEEGWEAWKKTPNTRIGKNYILTEMQFPDCKLLVFINIKNTISVMNEHYTLFSEVLGNHFNPHEIVNELRIGKQDSWRKIFAHYNLTGILLGYGKENACRFKETSKRSRVSENNDPRIQSEFYLKQRPFRLPIFVILDEDEGNSLIEKYKNERKAIKEKYEGRDFLSVTLSRLCR